MQEKWEEISKIFDSGFLIGRFVSATVSPVCAALVFLYHTLIYQFLHKFLPITNLSFTFTLSFQFASYDKAKEVEEFFASRVKTSIVRTLKQSIERVHINARWVQSVQKEHDLPEAVRELAWRRY